MAVLSGPFAEVVKITEDVANKTEGLMTEQYVKEVSKQNRNE
ncbi:MAG TPA: hypothetical protein VF233_05420 [Nitrososphaeraceae archaeon]